MMFTHTKMKTLLLLLCLLPGTLFGQCGSYYPGSLRSVVTGDQVTLYNDTALRNCGAMYQMKAGIMNDTIVWLQSDTGWVYGCICNFDLSVTLDSLPTGNHVVKVYYTEYPGWGAPYEDTCLVGLIFFEVTQQNSNTGLWKSDEVQGDCYQWTGMPDLKAEEPFIINVNDIGSVVTVTSRLPGHMRAVLFDLHGREHGESSSAGGVCSFSTALLPEGIYMVRIEHPQAIRTLKFIRP